MIDFFIVCAITLYSWFALTCLDHKSCMFELFFIKLVVIIIILFLSSLRIRWLRFFIFDCCNQWSILLSCNSFCTIFWWFAQRLFWFLLLHCTTYWSIIFNIFLYFWITSLLAPLWWNTSLFIMMWQLLWLTSSFVPWWNRFNSSFIKFVSHFGVAVMNRFHNTDIHLLALFIFNWSFWHFAWTYISALVCNCLF